MDRKSTTCITLEEDKDKKGGTPLQRTFLIEANPRRIYRLFRPSLTPPARFCRSCARTQEWMRIL